MQAHRRQYEDLNAAALYCNKCRKSMPVREKLLLVLPQGYLFEYLCVNCGESLGEKTVRLGKEDRMLF
ncbi:MAG: hypothetical protein HY810_06505 [Candidatus Omnitrophica bacterium]|nr:hypothetical protein [Candidatus Omnitrophota bacterium]